MPKIVDAEERLSVKLLNGATAPVIGPPTPVVFSIIDGIVIPLNDGSSVRLESRLVGAASGVEEKSRVLIALKALYVRFPNGRRRQFDVEGEVLGGDQQSGFAGTLIPAPATPTPDPTQLLLRDGGRVWVSVVQVLAGQIGVAVIRSFPSQDELGAALLASEKDAGSLEQSGRAN